MIRAAWLQVVASAARAVKTALGGCGGVGSDEGGDGDGDGNCGGDEDCGGCDGGKEDEIGLGKGGGDHDHGFQALLADSGDTNKREGGGKCVSEGH